MDDRSKKAVGGLVIVVLVAAAALVVVSRRRGPTIPEVRAPFGLLPPIPAETRSIDEIKKATLDPAPAVRREALRSLGRLEDHRRLPATEVLPLLARATQDPSPEVRAVATAYVGNVRVRASEVVPLLTSLLKDPDALVRMNAARGLRLHGVESREAVPALLVTVSDVDFDVRVNAANALIYFPEVRYEVPNDWNQLSKDDAAKRAREMGLSVTGDSLHHSVDSNDPAGVFVLLRAGVDPNSRSTKTPAAETPLFHVAGSRRPEMVRYLLEAGADVHFKDKFGRTPLDWIAATQGPFAEEVKNALREAGSAR